MMVLDADRWKQLALAGIALAASLMLAAPAAFAQGALKASHGDWQMRCDSQAPGTSASMPAQPSTATPGQPPAAGQPPATTQEQCALVQSVAAEDKPGVTLVVIILKTTDAKSRLLRVVAPLDVLLPAGLGLKVDEADIGRAGFVRCLPNGCVAEVVMDDNLIKQLKSGQTATFIVFRTPEEGIGIPVSLNGFAKGFDSLP